jgi:hypothetical protein
MKKDGFALIYVMIIVVPVTLLSMQILDLTSTDFKVSNNIVNSQQAYYLAESGIDHATYKLKAMQYPEGYKEIYYIYFNNTQIVISSNKPVSKDYTYVKISYDQYKKYFTIDSTSYFLGCAQNITKQIAKP